MGNKWLAPQMPQGVLELHRLDKQIVLRIESRNGHGRFEIEAQPLLNAQAFQLFAALGQIKEEHQVKHDWSSQDRVTAQEIYFDLHRITQPAENINVVPALFVVATRRVVIDADFVMNVSVEIGIKLRL